MKARKLLQAYTPEKVSRLIQVANRIDKIKSLASDIGEDIVLDIIDGWTTGDTLLDFVLVACDGVYDTSILSLQYRKLLDLGLRKPNQRILVVKKAEHHYDNEIFTLRNIVLAQLRPDTTKFDIDSLSIKIPVHPRFLVWKEFMAKNLFVSGYQILDTKWLTTGLLYNALCDFGKVTIDNQGFASVPDDAVCDIELFPAKDKSCLYEDHGIDTIMLDKLNQTWVQTLSNSI